MNIIQEIISILTGLIQILTLIFLRKNNQDHMKHELLLNH